MKKYIKSIKVLAFGFAVLVTACVPEGKDMMKESALTLLGFQLQPKKLVF